MKKLILIFTIFLQCSEPIDYLYSYTIRNISGFEIRMNCTGGCGSITIPNNQTKKIEGDHFLDAYTLESTTATTKVIDYDIVGSGSADYDIISYNYKVEYRVTGTATIIDATIEHSDGDPTVFTDETVPWSVKFKTFDSDFVYLSAQNGHDDNGCVKVEIYWRDKQLKNGQKCGPYQIATVSGGIY